MAEDSESKTNIVSFIIKVLNKLNKYINSFKGFIIIII